MWKTFFKNELLKCLFSSLCSAFPFSEISKPRSGLEIFDLLLISAARNSLSRGSCNSVAFCCFDTNWCFRLSVARYCALLLLRCCCCSGDVAVAGVACQSLKWLTASELRVRVRVDFAAEAVRQFRPPQVAH